MRAFAVRLWAVLCCLHLAVTFAHARHSPTVAALRAQLAAREADTAHLDARAHQLRASLAALRSPRGQESVVRDELGWVRPGEVLLELSAPP